MKKQLTASVVMIAAAVSLSSWAAGDHGHNATTSEDLDMGSMSMNAMDMSQMKKLPVKPGDAPGGHGMHGGMGSMPGMSGMHGGHAHDSWAEPPEEHANSTFSQWESFERAKSGMTLYSDNCASCHGLDGRGTGPLAKSLKHPPADLTNHFHMKPGQGDQYLFWRVTEGGQIEPFKSADSAMPAFKHTLSEAQRWDVLAYVHQAFHRGFKNESGMKLGYLDTGSNHH